MTDSHPLSIDRNTTIQSGTCDAVGGGGVYFIRYLPELAAVPDKFIHAPWTLPVREQTRIGAIIGQTYPAPIVDHAAQRVRALALFKTAGPTDSVWPASGRQTGGRVARPAR